MGDEPGTPILPAGVFPCFLGVLPLGLMGDEQGTPI